MTIRKLNLILRHLAKEGYNEAYIKFDNTGILSIEPVNQEIEITSEDNK
jgi:hypothetical protein